MTVFKNINRSNIAYTFCGNVLHFRLTVPNGRCPCSVGDVIKIVTDITTAEGCIYDEMTCFVYNIEVNTSSSLYVYARRI